MRPLVPARFVTGENVLVDGGAYAGLVWPANFRPVDLDGSLANNRAISHSGEPTLMKSAMPEASVSRAVPREEGSQCPTPC